MDSMTFMPYGKTFPVPFARGYITAYIHARGLAVARASYQLLGAQRIADREVREAKLAPLIRYFQFDNSQLPYEPLDYSLVALLYQGLCANYRGISEEQLSIMTREIGQVWWGKDPESGEIAELDNLKHLLTPQINQTLNTWKLNRDTFNTSHKVAQSNQQLAQFAIQTFVNELRTQSGIDCHWFLQDLQLKIYFQECPICLGHVPPCQVFVGVIAGFLSWLQTALASQEIRLQLHISETHTSGHMIVLDIAFLPEL